LPQVGRVFGADGGIREEPRDADEIIIGEKSRGFLGEETRGVEHGELFAAIEIEHGAEAFENLTADAAVAGFEAAERAAVDVREVSGLFLGETALRAEMREEGTELGGKSGAWSGIRRRQGRGGVSCGHCTVHEQ
jgi:hypothetical protein